MLNVYTCIYGKGRHRIMNWMIASIYRIQHDPDFSMSHFIIKKHVHMWKQRTWFYDYVWRGIMCLVNCQVWEKCDISSGGKCTWQRQYISSSSWLLGLKPISSPSIIYSTAKLYISLLDAMSWHSDIPSWWLLLQPLEHKPIKLNIWIITLIKHAANGNFNENVQTLK
jgi:hypothetical protein